MIRDLSLLLACLCLAAGFAVGQVQRQDRAPAPPIVLRAEWGKIQHSSHRRHETKELAAVLQPEPAVEEKIWSWDAFSALIPADDVGVGKAFELDFAAVRPFLEQIHPRPRPHFHMRWNA